MALFEAGLLALAMLAAVLLAWWDGHPATHASHTDAETRHIEAARRRAMREMTAHRLLAEEQMRRLLSEGPHS